MTDEEKAEAEHEERLMVARAGLYDSLKEARTALDSAIAEHNRLSQGDAFDVFDAEYEGGGEFAGYLRETSRLLDITRGVMPTGPSGELIENDYKRAIRALLQEKRRK